MSIPQQKDFDDSISLKILHEVSKQASEDKFLGPKLTVHQVSKMLKTAGASKSESRLLAQRFFDTFGVTPGQCNNRVYTLSLSLSDLFLLPDPFIYSLISSDCVMYIFSY